MATVRTANAHWEGSLMEGSGTVELASSGLATFDVSWPSRAEQALCRPWLDAELAVVDERITALRKSGKSSD